MFDVMARRPSTPVTSIRLFWPSHLHSCFSTTLPHGRVPPVNPLGSWRSYRHPHSTCRHREVFDVASDAPLSALMGPVPIPYGSTHRADMPQLRSARSCEKRAQRHAIDVDLDVGLDGGEPSCGLPYSKSARSNDLNSPHAAWLSAIMSWS